MPVRSPLAGLWPRAGDSPAVSTTVPRAQTLLTEGACSSPFPHPLLREPPQRAPAGMQSIPGACRCQTPQSVLVGRRYERAPASYGNGGGSPWGRDQRSSHFRRLREEGDYTLPKVVRIPLPPRFVRSGAALGPGSSQKLGRADRAVRLPDQVCVSHTSLTPGKSWLTWLCGRRPR